jgi:hypothetical protein
MSQVSPIPSELLMPLQGKFKKSLCDAKNSFGFELLS